jgi:cytoskeletal protein CcmA (bactofilin family)
MPVFGGAKKTADSLNYGTVQTIIGEGTEIKGMIHSTGVVRIDGVLEGTVEHQGDLIIGPKGKVTADIKSKALAVAVAYGLAIEGMQVLLRVGIFDIDDVILNGLGVMIGYGAYRLVARWMRAGRKSA